MARQRRSYRIECLETRNLLSTIQGPQTAIVSIMKARTVTVTGSFDGSFAASLTQGVAFSGPGTIKGVGSATLQGSILANLVGAKPGTKFSGSFTVFASDQSTLGTFTTSGKVPNKPTSPIPLNVTGTSSANGLPHTLKGTANLKVLSLNTTDGTGTFHMTFRLTGKK